MQALFSILQPLFKKLAELFDLFDLSFFVAGGSSVLAIGFVAWTLGLHEAMVVTDGLGWFLAGLIMVTV